jgi:hypothetical protein
MVQGNVMVGTFQAIDREVRVELFDPANPSTTVAATVSMQGRYFLDLGATPARDACTFHMRGILWNGEVTSSQPLFTTVPSPCALPLGTHLAATLTLPAYAPLDEPFIVEGEVLIDGRTARAQEAHVEIRTRQSWLLSVDTVRTDADGRYRVETRDAAQRFAWCSQILGSVRDASHRVAEVQLGALPPSECGNRRALPDVRMGTLKAVVGALYLNNTTMERYLGAEEAWAELIRVSDGAVGERFPLLDDGSFHVWFPHGLSDPACGWILRVTLASGPSDVRDISGSGPCQGPTNHWMFVSDFSTPYGAPLALAVEDPIGDNTGLTDLTGMTLRFDPQTGIYELELVASAAQPIQGEFRVNINLFNPSRQSFFDDTVNDFNLQTPTTTLKLTGYHRALHGWMPGDEVHTNSLRGTPNPPGSTLFRSGISHFPMGFLNNEDTIAFADLTRPAVVVVAGP